MLASVLNTPRAIRFSLVVVKAFVQYKNEFSVYKDLLTCLQHLQSKVKSHDLQLKYLIQELHRLIIPPATPKREMGFHVKV